HLLHEETAGGRTGKLQWVLPGSPFRPFARTSRRSHLGNRYGVYPGRGEFHRSSNFLRDWPIGADGGCLVGSPRLERICRSGQPSQILPCPYVRLLLPCHFVSCQSERLMATGALKSRTFGGTYRTGTQLIKSRRSSFG